MTLTTWERLMCAAVVGGITGTAKDIREAGKLLDILELTPDQAARIGLRQGADGSMDWQDKDTVWPLEIDSKGTATLLRSVEAFNGWAARDSKRVDSLLEKLQVA